MQTLVSAMQVFEQDTRLLTDQPGVTEETFYPAIRQVIAAALHELSLPFEVRTGTSELRPGAGRDRPDFVIADGAMVAVYGEAKTPSVELSQLYLSTERDDQIGRYLARTGVVVICNVREIGLVLCRAGVDRNGVTRVAPDDRELVRSVALWGATGSERRATQYLELVELALLD